MPWWRIGVEPVPRHFVVAWAIIVFAVGAGGLTGFIFGCAQITTYRFEQEGWTPPVYNTVSEMITRNALCTNTFTAWLIAMMVLTFAAVVCALSILLETHRRALAGLLSVSFVVAAVGAGVVLRYPHIAESEFWEWYKSNSSDPFVNPNHSGTNHDVGAGMVLVGTMAVIGIVAWVSGSMVTIGFAVSAAAMLGLLIGGHAAGWDIYYYEYAYLYAVILAGASAGAEQMPVATADIAKLLL